MYRRATTMLPLLPLCLTGSASVANAQFQADEWWLQSFVWGDGGFVYATEHTTSPSLPFSLVQTATDGFSTAETTYDFSVQGSTASFDFLFDHVRDGTQEDRAVSWGWIHILPIEDLRYDLEGWYALTGSQTVVLDTYLRDNQAQEWVFASFQRSVSTDDEFFVLGEQGGDDLNELVGSPSGTLLAGGDYTLSYQAGIWARPASDDGASGAGSVSFMITPEPITLWLLCGAGLGVRTQKRR